MHYVKDISDLSLFYFISFQNNLATLAGKENADHHSSIGQFYQHGLIFFLSVLTMFTQSIKSYSRCWPTFFDVSIVFKFIGIWILIFNLGNYQALISGCNPNPNKKNKAIFRWAFSLQNWRDFLGFQENGGKRELGAKCKSFFLSLAWKYLKQKLISFQVKVDRYKSELPDLQIP